MPDDHDVARIGERLLWLALAAGSSVVLALAFVVEPDPRGFGTHTQLGLPPCGFLALTGLACPGCGLTTAFAHGVRGQWLAAHDANPLGLLFFAVACLSIPLGVVAALRGWRFSVVTDRLALDRWALVGAALALGAWGVRVASG